MSEYIVYIYVCVDSDTQLGLRAYSSPSEVIVLLSRQSGEYADHNT